jgi:hypothetical protein
MLEQCPLAARESLLQRVRNSVHASLRLCERVVQGRECRQGEWGAMPASESPCWRFPEVVQPIRRTRSRGGTSILSTTSGVCGA